MKTSNKLIIALAAALIVVPIIVIAVNVRFNYRKMDYRDSYSGANQINTEDFNQKSIGRIAIGIAQPFTSVRVDDAKGISVQIYVKTSERFGIKIQDVYKDLINTTVNQKGELLISFADKMERGRNDKVILVVYCPAINAIEVKNSYITELAATADTLNVKITDAQSVFFTGNFTYNDDKRKKTEIESPTKIGTLNLSLKDTEFAGYNAGIKNIKIEAAKSTINLGASDPHAVVDYNSLSILAKDNSTVNIEHTTAKTAHGDFSDDTQMKIPTSMLKQMLTTP